MSPHIPPTSCCTPSIPTVPVVPSPKLDECCQSPSRWRLRLVAGGSLGVLAYANLTTFADIAVAWLGLERTTAIGEATHFFLYDTPKVLLLLAGVVFLMGVIQTWFSPARTRALLTGKRNGIGNVLSASLGIVTPFCSCSAVPLFIGFLSSGVPLGVTFSFLIAAPMINEIALALLLAMFGWKVALLYLIMGLMVAILSGLIIGHLRMEARLEDWVRDIHDGKTPLRDGDANLRWEQRCDAGVAHMKAIVAKIWPYVVVGIAVGATIHGYVPDALLASFMGKDVWWAVPAAVVLGIPMYASAAGMIPVVEALIAKGAALGTVLAFMMSVTALSAPEMIILRRALKPRLIATFAGVVACGILLVGYVFNAVL